MKKLTTITIVCLVLLVGFAVTVTAISGNSLTYLLDRAGDKLGTLIFGQMSDQIVEIKVSAIESSLGAASVAGVTQATFKIAQKAMNNATITPVSMLNDSGQDRIITNVKTWWEASQSADSNDVPVGVNGDGGGPTGTAAGATGATLLLGATTSTDAYTTSTSFFLMEAQVFPTSTSGILTPQLSDNDSPTGLTNAGARLWLNGEYLNFRFGGVTPTQSTSTGLIIVEYVVR